MYTWQNKQTNKQSKSKIYKSAEMPAEGDKNLNFFFSAKGHEAVQP